MFDICIIGGGAAGLFAAAAIKKHAPERSVVIIERLPRVGKKLSLTGNGRCNISNKDINISHYSGDKSFAEDILSRFTLSDCEEFFSSIGVLFAYEGDRAYPMSFQASSVGDALRFFCEENGVAFRLEECVKNIEKRKNIFIIKTDKGEISSRTVIAAGGLLSGGKRLGCDGTLFEILKKAGVKTVEPRPTLTKIKTELDFVRQLKGVKINAEISLFRGENLIKTESGELLFAEYGVSGPPVLALSAYSRAGDILSIDLCPYLDEKTLAKILKDRAKTLKRSGEEFLSGVLQKRLGQVAVKRAGFALHDKISEKDAAAIAKTVKHFTLSVIGNTGFEDSQASAGGLFCGDFDKKTLECRKIPGLFAAGEILDVTGECGGFNLHWAFASANAAALGALTKTEGEI